MQYNLGESLTRFDIFQETHPTTTTSPTTARPALLGCDRHTATADATSQALEHRQRRASGRLPSFGRGILAIFSADVEVSVCRIDIGLCQR